MMHGMGTYSGCLALLDIVIPISNGVKWLSYASV